MREDGETGRPSVAPSPPRPLVPSPLMPRPAAADPVIERLSLELRAAHEQVTQLRGELEERNAEVQLLHEIATALTAAASLEEMLEFIAATAVRVTETDSASIYVLDETKGELILRATHEAPTGLVGRLRLKLGEGITGEVTWGSGLEAPPSGSEAEPSLTHGSSGQTTGCSGGTAAISLVSASSGLEPEPLVLGLTGSFGGTRSESLF